jgi:hypothetical protein
MKGMSLLRSVSSLNIDLKFIGNVKTSKCRWVWHTAELNILKCWKMAFFIFHIILTQTSFMLHENCWCWLFPEHAVKVKKLQSLPWQSVWFPTINSIGIYILSLSLSHTRARAHKHTHKETLQHSFFTQKSYLHTLIRVKLRNRRPCHLINNESDRWSVWSENMFTWHAWIHSTEAMFIFSCSSCRH